MWREVFAQGAAYITRKNICLEYFYEFVFGRNPRESSTNAHKKKQQQKNQSIESYTWGEKFNEIPIHHNICCHSFMSLYNAHNIFYLELHVFACIFRCSFPIENHQRKIPNKSQLVWKQFFFLLPIFKKKQQQPFTKKKLKKQTATT